jgi:hypothetical protein
MLNEFHSPSIYFVEKGSSKEEPISRERMDLTADLAKTIYPGMGIIPTSTIPCPAALKKVSADGGSRSRRRKPLKMRMKRSVAASVRTGNAFLRRIAPCSVMY